ncbi:DUF4267 domain-containing protein [Brevundimonas sp.]|jgi:hypothetical protein|uniref:DUF4267 domain-containing protein n=1 Tax=Brevundimonas sp. TaxID=1871086 RepID=UPI002E1206B9|nr:DUF4267 domain-containing protein [Brevundimonas sp.]
MSDPVTRRPTRLSVRIGYGLALVIAAWMGVNTLRAFLAPDAFARSFGLDGAQATDPGFVQVYALRALFLGVFALFLVVRAEARLLGWFALIAVVMPVGDALLVATAGAAPGTVARHAAIAVYLLLTATLLLRTARTR